MSDSDGGLFKRSLKNFLGLSECEALALDEAVEKKGAAADKDPYLCNDQKRMQRLVRNKQIQQCYKKQIPAKSEQSVDNNDPGVIVICFFKYHE